MIRLILKPLSFLPALFMMYTIFGFSAQDAATSSSLSLEISYEIIETTDQVFHMELSVSDKESLVHKIHSLVRKCGHFTEYLLLGLAVSFPLALYGLRGKRLFFSAFLFCLLFSISDEIHQHFVEGRSPQVLDVFIDSLGSLIGILPFYFFLRKTFPTDTMISNTSSSISES